MSAGRKEKNICTSDVNDKNALRHGVLSPVILGVKMRKPVACAFFDSEGDYFFAGVVWVAGAVLTPERTE